MLRVGDGLVLGPDPLVIGDDPAVTQHPHPVQIRHDLDPAADHGRIDGIVVGVQPDVMITRQPGEDRQPVTGGTGGSESIAGLAAVIRSAGAQPGARMVRGCWPSPATRSAAR